MIIIITATNLTACFSISKIEALSDITPSSFGFEDGILIGCGPDSVVGIATGYGLYCPGIESRWGRDFLHLSSPALEAHPASCKWVQGISRG